MEKQEKLKKHNVKSFKNIQKNNENQLKAIKSIEKTLKKH